MAGETIGGAARSEDIPDVQWRRGSISGIVNWRKVNQLFLMASIDLDLAINLFLSGSPNRFSSTTEVLDRNR